MRVRAFGLVEMLMSLAISAIVLYAFSAVIFRLPDPLAVQREIENIQAFLTQLQAEARFNRRNYGVVIAQSGARWCILGLEKKSGKTPACHCFQPACMMSHAHRVYYSRYGTVLTASKLYPSVFMHISGHSANNSGNCLSVNKGSEKISLQFQQSGVMNVVQSKSRSRCG